MAELPTTLYCVVKMLKNGFVEAYSLHQSPGSAQRDIDDIKRLDVKSIVADVDVWEMRRYKP